MAREKELPRLSPAELEVMKTLWDERRLGAREIHEHIAEGLGWAYSTTRTTLERMVHKGLVSKRSLHGLHVYQARISKAAGLARLVRDFAERVLDLQPAPVVSLFDQSEVLDQDEISELRSLLGANEDPGARAR